MPRCAVVGEVERVAWRFWRADGQFMPRLQKESVQSGRERFCKGDWSMKIWDVKGWGVKSSA